MVVLMVQVGCVCVGVDEWFVLVPVTVRLTCRVIGSVAVSKVLVVDVQVLVFYRLVAVLVLVPLASNQPRSRDRSFETRARKILHRGEVDLEGRTLTRLALRV